MEVAPDKSPVPPRMFPVPFCIIGLAATGRASADELRPYAAPAAKAFADLVTGPAGRAKLTQHGLRASQD